MTASILCIWVYSPEKRKKQNILGSSSLSCGKHASDYPQMPYLLLPGIESTAKKALPFSFYRRFILWFSMIYYTPLPVPCQTEDSRLYLQKSLISFMIFGVEGIF
ncbi:MAG: hypothetical protein A2939_03380 [Parcubacteria group bacterium RIFCSPLOWO2_01_FULL_48_18]|nr:MAG: hypothetical protein A2939_03380 [Parcubacteria group bacterium RIFCSPLOWO2_01_FULL_48_18]